MKKLLIALAFVSFNVSASEAICDLYKAKAELSSSLLASPYVYGSSNENSTATVALGYSLAGRTKGQLAKDLAEAKCISIMSTSELDEQQRWVIVAIHKAGAKSEIVQLLRARDLSKQHLELVEAQLKAQVSTVAEYNSAKQVSSAIDNKILVLRTMLAEPSAPVNADNIRETLSKAKSAEGTVAELMARQEIASSWDVILAAGAQKDLQDSSSGVGPFAGITFRWSFGNYGAKESLADIKKKTELAFDSSQTGYTKSADRLFAKISDMITIEKDRELVLLDSITDTTRILGTFKDLNTALALITRTNLEIQLAIYTAELNGVRTRIERYSGIKNLS